ncbi:hypothetical protein ACWEPR_39560, partial [Streptomyces sp. NPDC004290]
TAGPVQTARAEPSAPMCTRTEPKLCVWPEERMYIPRLEAMARRVSELPPFITSPSAFYEEGLKGDSAQDTDFSIFEGSMWEVADSMSIAISRASTPPFCPAVNSSAEDRRMMAYFELDSWLAARISGAGQPSGIHGGPPGVDQRAIARLIEQPKQVQEDWAKKRIKVIEGTPEHHKRWLWVSGLPLYRTCTNKNLHSRHLADAVTSPSDPARSP